MFWNLRGGTAKSTLALASARALIELGKSVAVIDLDPSMRNNFFEVPLISTESDVFDFTIVDCPPRYDEEMRDLMILADYVIVPIPIFSGNYYEDHFVKYCDPSKSILIPVCLSDFCIHPEVKGFFMLDDQYHFKGNVDFESTMIAKRLASYIMSLQ